MVEFFSVRKIVTFISSTYFWIATYFSLVVVICINCYSIIFLRALRSTFISRLTGVRNSTTTSVMCFLYSLFSSAS